MIAGDFYDEMLAPSNLYLASSDNFGLLIAFEGESYFSGVLLMTVFLVLTDFLGLDGSSAECFDSFENN